MLKLRQLSWPVSPQLGSRIVLGHGEARGGGFEPGVLQAPGGPGYHVQPLEEGESIPLRSSHRKKEEAVCRTPITEEQNRSLAFCLTSAIPSTGEDSGRKFCKDVSKISLAGRQVPLLLPGGRKGTVAWS